MKFEFTISSYVILIFMGIMWWVGCVEVHPDKFPFRNNYACIKNYQYEIVSGELKPRMIDKKYVLCEGENKNEK